MGNRLISGILQRADLNAFTLASIVENRDVGTVLQRLAEHRINIEFVNQIPHKNGSIGVILCVDKKDVQSTHALLEGMKTTICAGEISPLGEVGILSLFPHREHAVISGMIMKTLSESHIPLLAMASSLSAISCVIQEEQTLEALSLLSRKFGLS
jgi:aspartokinase